MKVHEFIWDTVTSIAQKDYQQLRVLPDEDLLYPVLSKDGAGYVVKVPLPKLVKGEFYQLHGLYFDNDDQSVEHMWRVFKASLYHAALHAAYSDFARYAPWAKGKEPKTATFCVSLVEDYKVTFNAVKSWPGVVGDLAYANYVSSMRMGNIEEMTDPAQRYATKLLLTLWGFRRSDEPSEEDTEIDLLAARVASLVRESIRADPSAADRPLWDAAQAVYGSVTRLGALREVPFLAHMESHGPSRAFDSRLMDDPGAEARLKSVYDALGAATPTPEEEQASVNESREFFEMLADTREKASRVTGRLEDLMSLTRLQGVEFPKGDYGTFLRVRASLSGPIRNIRDQLRLAKNVADETAGHESGQVDMQMAMQVVASGNVRNDIFTREESVYKNESWAILIDASKSISPAAQTAAEVATCLSEVAKDLIPDKKQWGLYSFNNTFQVLKDFEEDYNVDTKARIGGIVQRNATLLPDALSMCHRLLASKPTDVKIMVVVSDGHPTGYSGIESQLVSTIKNITKTGVLLMGIGVDSRTIQDYFTVNCVVDSPYQMMKSFVKSYLQLSSMF
ncbi:MAG: VWA domain-containing protein [Nitrososphaerota archaeon]|nr:VWA domain-containing protein [Nitrososphaerota archaeon]